MTPEVRADEGAELDLIDYDLTSHAEMRMQQRGVLEDALEAALDYGRVVYTRGAVVHAIGRKEVDRYAVEGIDLSEYDGVQVVCTGWNQVITVYRNRSFRKLRPNLGRRGGRRLQR